MITKLFREVRRRKVIRAAITYVVSGWLVIQIADVLVDAFDGPGWLLQMLITAVAIGLPAPLSSPGSSIFPPTALSERQIFPWTTRQSRSLIGVPAS